ATPVPFRSLQSLQPPDLLDAESLPGSGARSGNAVHLWTIQHHQQYSGGQPSIAGRAQADLVTNQPTSGAAVVTAALAVRRGQTSHANFHAANFLVLLELRPWRQLLAFSGRPRRLQPARTWIRRSQPTRSRAASLTCTSTLTRKIPTTSKTFSGSPTD